MTESVEEKDTSFCKVCGCEIQEGKPCPACLLNIAVQDTEYSQTPENDSDFGRHENELTLEHVQG
ncbi:MAG: hypothetical protein ACRC2T_17235, partial [Thermoguttaceae bacterium]